MEQRVGLKEQYALYNGGLVTTSNRVESSTLRIVACWDRADIEQTFANGDAALSEQSIRITLVT
jgi:hypothetical protein